MQNEFISAAIWQKAFLKNANEEFAVAVENTDGIFVFKTYINTGV